MIKIFKANENGKIELTLEELTQLLQEAEEEGRKNVILTQPLSPVTPAQLITSPINPQPWLTVPYCGEQKIYVRDIPPKTISSNETWTAPANSAIPK